MQLAGQLINEGRLEQAAAVARRVTELAPNNPEGWFFIGSALLGLGDADEAEVCLEKALRCDGARLDYCRWMAEVCMQRGDMKKAAEWCEQGIGLERNSLHFHLTLGRAKAFGGDLNGACECLERCVSLNPDDHRAREQLGNLYLRRNNYGAAIEQFRAALAKGATGPSLWGNLGHVLSRQGEKWEAVKAFRRAVVLDPSDATHLYDLGDAYLALDEPKKAVAVLLQAVARRPDYPLAHYDLGLAFFELAKYEEGAAASRAALANDPEMKVQQSNLGVGATNNLGLCLSNLGRMEEAVECFERSLQVFASTYFNLGLALFRLHRYEDALANFKKAVDINPNDAEYLDLLGNAYSELGRKAEARAALERSIDVDPRYALAHYDLGTVLAPGTGEEPDRALNCFETAIGLDPSLSWAYYSAGCIHARAGRATLALQFIEKALEKGLSDFNHIRKDPDLDQLRQDSSFLELLGRYQKPVAGAQRATDAT
jgi:superkiller protein 3